MRRTSPPRSGRFEVRYADDPASGLVSRVLLAGPFAAAPGDAVARALPWRELLASAASSGGRAGGRAMAVSPDREETGAAGLRTIPPAADEPGPPADADPHGCARRRSR